MPCNSALLAPKNSICLGLKFSSESKLFGEGPSCLRTISATLPQTDISELSAETAYFQTVNKLSWRLEIRSTDPD